MDKITLLELHRLEKRLQETEAKGAALLQEIRSGLSKFILEFATEEDLRLFYEIVYSRYSDAVDPL